MDRPSAALTVSVIALEGMLAFEVDAKPDDSISRGALDGWYFFLEVVEHCLEPFIRNKAFLCFHCF